MYVKSRYSVSRFFTPPRLEKLNLDLAELSGGGYAPSQFEGKTHDGREVYCRYRGGRFAVHVADDVGDDAVSEGTKLVDVRLGPPFHGGMTLGQVCHYAGITINGTMPPLPTPEEMVEATAKDLSGDTSFYDVWINSTHATQRSFLQRLLNECDEAAILHPVLTQAFEIASWEICSSVDAIEQDFFSIVFAEDRANGTLLSPPRHYLARQYPDALLVDIRASGFRHPIRPYADMIGTWLEQRDLKLAIAGHCEDMLYGTLSVHACYSKAGSKKHRLLQVIDAVIDDVYPAYSLEKFDVATGQPIAGEEPIVMHFDPAIAEWMQGHADRWFAVLRDGYRETERAVGQKLMPLGKRAPED